MEKKAFRWIAVLLFLAVAAGCAEKKAYVQAALPKNVPDALIEAAVYDQRYWRKEEASANGFLPAEECGEGGGVPAPA